ncbi:PEPxxWA-CTERM sorting domain-containing protein [Sphingomonas mollis]|uniref:PEP-CTERM sorting domain-containing protein n=1 Tax=Sphingomonas mollis TaxID=2795726 RepID=A0ABS0XUS2_9SPHN|nr:PEPxxWA-CTERM sorting domain-containing protein [Sphingomonas sp. BT553]MBJ6123498.1 PEP-CTERM sorting domain-containing protein [Sphingomonas sp. BT553]
MLTGIVTTPAAAADFLPGIQIQGVSVINQYSYTFGDAQPPLTTGGETGTFLASDRRPDPSSQLGVQFTGQANPDSFFFLHNDYCVGQCQISSSTTIRFQVFVADASNYEGLRFDSLITPGHLAQVAITDDRFSTASFAFTVSRTDVVRGQATGPTTNLYTANGYADGSGLRVSADGQQDPFSNTIAGDNLGAGYYYDWSATPLSVQLGAIATGQTFYVDYTASYSVNSSVPCTDILNCNAAQVVFGDPRTRGGGTDLVARNGAGGIAVFEQGIDGGVHAVIDREYDASTIPFAFVRSDAPELGVTVPPPNAPITYVDNYIPSAIDTVSGVPEPATWISMVLGFGVAGAALRRRGGRYRTMA